MAEQKSLIPGAIGNDHDQGFGELRDRKPEGMVLCGSFPHSMLRCLWKLFQGGLNMLPLS